MKTALRLLAAVLPAVATLPALANDFPTVERVLYVQDCMKGHPGPYYEMVSKCSCALDKLATKVKHEEYVTMTTVVNAMSIGGERGNDFRDNETLKPQVKRYRALQSEVQQACFINPR